LTSATLLAQQGHGVTLFEHKTLGGMAASESRDGFTWNWGGHALYRRGPGVPILRSLGVRPRGFVVKGAPYMHALYDGAVVPAPFSARTALSPLLEPADRMEFLRVMSSVPLHARGSRVTQRNDVSWASWLDEQVSRPRVRELVGALVRLTSFTHDPERQSAAAALRQLFLGAGGVWYLHDGWQQLVDGLREAALRAGVDIREHQRVSAVDHDTKVRAVQFTDGHSLDVDGAVIAAGGPRVVSRLLDGPGADIVSEWDRAAVPVRAATWELNLRTRRDGPHVWVLGVDTPVYLNVQSHFAQGLAPQGTSMVHVLRYLGPQDPSAAHRDEMTKVLDLALPGWRDEVIDDRFLPALTVMHDMPLAANGGFAGRPGPAVPGVDGLMVAGDWVGRRGILADAALASAQDAAKMLDDYLVGPSARQAHEQAVR